MSPDVQQWTSRRYFPVIASRLHQGDAHTSPDVQQWTSRRYCPPPAAGGSSGCGKRKVFVSFPRQSASPGEGPNFLERHLRLERIIILYFHFIGLGLFVTLNVAGIILHRHYRKAPDLAAKAVILRAGKSVGLISPFAVVLMLITGIGNMHELGLGILDAGWLTAKIIFFAIAIISGVLISIQAGKRGKLVGQMIAGGAPADADAKLAGLDRQIFLGHVVMPILLTIIVLLSIYGRVGGPG